MNQALPIYVRYCALSAVLESIFKFTDNFTYFTLIEPLHPLPLNGNEPLLRVVLSALRLFVLRKPLFSFTDDLRKVQRNEHHLQRLTHNIRADAACRIQALFRGARTRWTLLRSNDPRVTRVVMNRAGRSTAHLDRLRVRGTPSENVLKRLSSLVETG